jgi:hypothetical protein
MGFSQFLGTMRSHWASRRKRRAVQPPQRRGVRLSLESLEERMALSTLYVTPDTAGGIQAVVNQAQSGDTIIVAPGIYNEQVTINNVGHDRNNLTLEGSGQNFTFIQAPSTLTGSNAIVDVDGSQGVTIEGFTIEGPSGTAYSGGSLYGVRVEGGGSATITQNHITNIEDTPFNGAQEGIAIDVGRQSDGTTGTAVISYNTIDNYQKGGILVDNAGSSAEIMYNTIIGAGPTSLIAQNGIQISRGATATVSYNDVSNNEYTPSPQSTGILVYDDDSTVTITNNTLANNDYDISFYDVHATSSDHVNFNTIVASTVAGLDFEGDTSADSTGTLDASNNYWGTGQKIVDANNGGVGTGVVNFTSALTTNTAVTVNNATLAFNAGNQVTLTAAVSNIGPDPVNTGTVTFAVLQGSNTITSVTSGTVGNGAASAVVTLPGGTLPGNYTITAVYNPGGLLVSSSGSGTLNVESAPSSPSVPPSPPTPPAPPAPSAAPTPPPAPPSLFDAALTLFIDGAEIMLDAHDLGPALGLPPIGLLMHQIESTLPYAGPLGMPALAAGAGAAEDALG